MGNKKILIVEDDSNFGSILRDYLSINNYKITLAKNGIEGYQKFIKDEFDLCILDVMMPYKDGFTLAKEIREKSIDELNKLLDETSLEHFKLKMQLTTGQLPTHRQVRESRKNIALIKTIINEKRLADGTK